MHIPCTSALGCGERLIGLIQSGGPGAVLSPTDAGLGTLVPARRGNGPLSGPLAAARETRRDALRVRETGARRGGGDHVRSTAALASAGGRLIFAIPLPERRGTTMTAGSHATDRAVLRVSGPEVRDFLQGLVTNDVRRLDAGPVYAALLTPQGKYLFDFFLIADGADVLIDVAADRAAALAPAARRCTASAPRSRSSRPTSRSSSAPAPRPAAPSPTRATPRSAGAACAADPAGFLAGMPPLDPAAIAAIRVAHLVPGGRRRAAPRRQLHPRDGLRAPARRRLPQGLLRRPGGHRPDEAQDRAPQGPRPRPDRRRRAARRHRGPPATAPRSAPSSPPPAAEASPTSASTAPTARSPPGPPASSARPDAAFPALSPDRRGRRSR